MLRARAGRLARRVRLSRKNGLISQHRRYSVIDAMDIHPDIKSPPPLDMQGEPYALAAAIEGAGLRRGFVVFDRNAKKAVPSHAELQPLADFLNADKVDYMRHEGMFFEIGRHTRALHGAFLWNTTRGQGCGGIRLREYTTAEEYIRDGMRLATGMGRKSALAGLWAGGGKGVIASPPEMTVVDVSEIPDIPFGPEWELKDTDSRSIHKYLGRPDFVNDRYYRNILFREYGDFLTSLRGCYVAAEDAGVTVTDVDQVFSRSRYTTCISPSLGGSGNPSVPTAAGIRSAMEGAMKFLGKSDGVRGKSVVIQGAGNVGRPLAGFLLERGVGRIIIADVSEDSLAKARRQFDGVGNVEVRALASDADTAALFAEPCDIFSPCAYGAVLNPKTIPTLRAEVVCGAANNQLQDPARDDELLREVGVVYVPDFVANRMGIVNCANEQYGRVGSLSDLDDPAITTHLDETAPDGVFQTTLRVLEEAASRDITTNKAAEALADKACEQKHPIWGHRGQSIIDKLVEDRWHEASA